jgi:lysophospholipase L1-like esterase
MCFRASIAALLLLSTPGLLLSAEVVRIVCIGDSITQGRKGSEGKMKGPTYSYRYPLWKKLLDAGIAVDLVGSQKGGFGGTATYEKHQDRDFDNEHEGYWGWTTQAVSDKLKTTSKSWTADFALIMLGTNDKAKEKTMTPTISAMTEIVQTLRQNNPRIAILIGEPCEEWEPFPEMGKAYEELATKLNSPDSPVIAVKHSTGWISNPDKEGTCTVDWVHPNAVGDEKVAANFLKAMEPLLKKGK